MNDEENDGAPRRDTRPHVRDRTEADLDACVRVLAEVHARDGYPVDLPAAPRTWLAPSSQLAAWVVEADGQVAGHAALARSGTGDAAPGVWSGLAGADTDATAVVSRLFVAPSARGLGLGALLMGRAVAEARERGLHPVLDVVVSDVAASALYERLGWRRLATVDQRWGPERKVAVHCYAAPAAVL